MLPTQNSMPFRGYSSLKVLLIQSSAAWSDPSRRRPLKNMAWAELEIDPVPALERSAVGKVSKSDWEQALEFTVGCYPGAANSFPVVGATLR